MRMGSSLQWVGKGRQARQPAWAIWVEEGIDGHLYYLSLMRTEQVRPAVVLGPVTQVPAILGSLRTWSLATFLSTVEYPLQLLHSPPAPVVKRPGVATHHPLQVLLCPLPPGTPLLCACLTLLESCLSYDGVVLLECFSFSCLSGSAGASTTAKPHSQAQGT